MKKVLLITIDFPPQVGGVANYYFNLCQNLPSQHIVVLTNHSSGTALSDQTTNFKIIRKKLFTRLPIWPKWLPMFWHIKQTIRQEKIDLLWVGQILPVGTVIYLSKKINLPYIVSLHGTDILFAQKHPRKLKMAQKILACAKYITCNSQHTSQLLNQWKIDMDKIKVIYPGVELKIQDYQIAKLKKIINQYSLRNKKILLSVGRLVRRKGTDNVIKALPKVWQQIPNLVYIIIGNGEDRKYLQSLKEKTIKKFNNKTTEQWNDDNILILDNINDQEKNIFYNLCDLFILPGRHEAGDIEGFGIVFLEAALHKKASIASHVGGAHEAVLDQKTGLLVDPHDIDQISQTIIKLLQDDDLRLRLGENGYRRVVEQFHWPQQAKLFSQLLE